MSKRNRVAAVVGVGHTDWVGDWKRVRAGERPDDCYGYAAGAFRNALADAEMTRDQIDGLIVGPTTAYERMAEVLNMNVRWGDQADAVRALIESCPQLTWSGCFKDMAGNDRVIHAIKT